jgi:hypothetical protein
MDRTTTTTDSLAGGSSAANPVGAKVEGVAKSAHQATDQLADKATAGVDRLSGTAHRTINTAADSARSAAEWASTIPEEARQVQARFTESASASIRARPITTVVGALVVGYLLGRLARL